MSERPKRSQSPTPDEPTARRGLERRALLLGGTSLGLSSALPGCDSGAAPSPEPKPPARSASALPAGEPTGSASRPSPRPSTRSSAVLDRIALGPPPWQTFDPFLFCVHHRDHYPSGNSRLGPTASLDGRRIGNDFAGKDGWSMYHGDVVPGFPRHPHRGFETVTITRRGYVDHSDSLGATARYGEGDVQWMTAGRGIVHAEMFPLLEREQRNPTELFQIWLNLPRRKKFVQPHFSMLWQNTIPVVDLTDARGRSVHVTVIAGGLGSKRAPSPPPSSWASEPSAAVQIWSIRMAPGSKLSLPASPRGVGRTLYFFSGESLAAAGEPLEPPVALRLAADRAIPLANGPREAELLLLEGRPIGEPVVKHGPFVMNDQEEIRQAVRDYRRTQFGGWPWDANDPVHPRESGRFAVHADGRRERAT